MLYKLHAATYGVRFPNPDTLTMPFFYDSRNQVTPKISWMCVLMRGAVPKPASDVSRLRNAQQKCKVKTMKKKRNSSQPTTLSAMFPGIPMHDAEVKASPQPRLLLDEAQRMASWLNSCLKLPIAAPVGSCALSRLWSFSRLVRLASLVVLPSAIRRVVRVLA
jgi:hypothetical protein